MFCALYSDRGSHFFWLTPKAGGKVDRHRLTQVGRAMRELGIQMIPAYSPQARGRIGTQLWDLAGPAAAGVAVAWDGRDAGSGECRFCASITSLSSIAAFRCAARNRAAPSMPLLSQDLDRIFFVLQFERTVNRRQHGQLSEPKCMQIEAVSLARHAGGLHR